MLSSCNIATVMHWSYYIHTSPNWAISNTAKAWKQNSYCLKHPHKMDRIVLCHRCLVPPPPYIDYGPNGHTYTPSLCSPKAEGTLKDLKFLSWCVGSWTVQDSPGEAEDGPGEAEDMVQLIAVAETMPVEVQLYDLWQQNRFYQYSFWQQLLSAASSLCCWSSFFDLPFQTSFSHALFPSASCSFFLLFSSKSSMYSALVRILAWPILEGLFCGTGVRCLLTRDDSNKP